MAVLALSWAVFSMTLLSILSVCLILVILIQRGRGGGLVSAFGGMSGQSAFGTRAGDIFTRITIGIIAAWVILAGLTGIAVRSENPEGKKFDGGAQVGTSKFDDGKPAAKDDKSAKDETDAPAKTDEKAAEKEKTPDSKDRE